MEINPTHNQKTLQNRNKRAEFSKREHNKRACAQKSTRMFPQGASKATTANKKNTTSNDET